MGVYARTIEGRTGVHPNTRCFRCRRTAAQSDKLGPVQTGIDHPEYYQTKSFYNYSEKGHACPRCHREMELGGAMRAMDAYAKKHGEKALAKRMGL